MRREVHRDRPLNSGHVTGEHAAQFVEIYRQLQAGEIASLEELTAVMAGMMPALLSLLLGTRRLNDELAKAGLPPVA